MKLLRIALRLDALVTAGNGLAYLALAGPLHDLLGYPKELFVPVGIFLILFGAGVWLASMPATPNRPLIGTIIVANVLWAVVSVAELATGALSASTVGAVWAVLQAGTVAGFAGFQMLGLRRAG
ncbi:hypothetical protein AB0M43_32360 [Longispora sp. NPDC051575]|uniref:hypothetical protein n=1 Tax=Longispora sp. NPDC051575 TaxID=3154943 RepID=UPI00343C28E2